MVKAIVSALATCMLYTGHEYPRVNEADIRYTFYYRALVAWRLGRLYHRNARVVPMVWMGRGNTNLTLKSSSGLLRRRKRRLSKVRDLLTPPGSSKPMAGCTNFLTVYLNSVNLWSFAFLSYLLSIFRVLLYLDILRESHGLDGFAKFCVNFLFKYRRSTAQACPERYKCFTCKQRLLAGKR